jgi:hypothetical protein
MTRSADVDITITSMTRNAAVVIITITITTRSAVADITIMSTNTIMNTVRAALAVATITIITTITRTRYSRALERKPPRSLAAKSLTPFSKALMRITPAV